MDDRRKARIKVFNTSSERICEVQTVDEAGNSSTTPMRYSNRRYSDFTCSTLTPIPAGTSNRRASENPVIPTTSSTTPATATASSSRGGFFKKTGIVVTNTDLMSIISSLASSATEINKCGETPVKTKASTSANTLAPDTASGGISRSNRSNSFDVSILQNAKQMMTGSSSSSDKNSAALSGWFEKRHQPAMARKKSIKNTASATVSFSRDVLDRLKDKEEGRHTRKPKSKLRWDNRGFVDANVIGNAIEGFLRKGTGKKSSSSSKDSRRKSTASTSWFGGKGDEDDSKDTCDSSLCTTIKDLFVK